MIYKVLNADGSCRNRGKGTWNLPTQNADGTWTPGEWMPAIEGTLVPCENGYHLCEGNQIIHWLGPAIFEAEYRGERVNDNDKVVVHEARLLRRLNWNDRSARLFACDCADRALPQFEKAYPDDKRPRNAIDTARRFAEGKATQEELSASLVASLATAAAAELVADTMKAAWAADAAAWAVAAEARAAAHAAYAAADAGYAGYAAAAAMAAVNAETAAWAAAGYAGYADARNDELDWQYRRLVDYLTNQQ